MQVVGVNSVDKKYPFERYLREASILPLYDAGNFGMPRRRVHGVMADPASTRAPSSRTRPSSSPRRVVSVYTSDQAEPWSIQHGRHSAGRTPWTRLA